MKTRRIQHYNGIIRETMDLLRKKCIVASLLAFQTKIVSSIGYSIRAYSGIELSRLGYSIIRCLVYGSVKYKKIQGQTVIIMALY